MDRYSKNREQNFFAPCFLTFCEELLRRKCFIGFDILSLLLVYLYFLGARLV